MTYGHCTLSSSGASPRDLRYAVKIRILTNSSSLLTIIAVVVLLVATASIFYYQFNDQIRQLFFVIEIYIALTLASWSYSIHRANHGDKL